MTPAQFHRLAMPLSITAWSLIALFIHAFNLRLLLTLTAAFLAIGIFRYIVAECREWDRRSYLRWVIRRLVEMREQAAQRHAEFLGGRHHV